MTMKYYVRQDEVEVHHGEEEHGSWRLVGKENGCTNGVHTGISYNKLEEYRTPERHDDQEGFCVLSGTGWARVGDQEFRLTPHTSFIAPAGVWHTVKCDDKNDPLTIFWFHAPAEK